MDPEFREFTFNRYHVFIYQDGTGKSICISQISNEILTFIHNRGNLSDDELLIKVKELIRKSRFFRQNCLLTLIEISEWIRLNKDVFTQSHGIHHLLHVCSALYCTHKI